MIRGLTFRPCWVWPFWDFYRKFLETEKAAKRRRAREHRQWLRDKAVFAERSAKQPVELVTAILHALREERERAAKIAETMGGDFIECDANGDGYREARRHIAAAIRGELLSGLDSGFRTGEESKSGVDVAEEAKGGSRANVAGSRGIGNEGSMIHPPSGSFEQFAKRIVAAREKCGEPCPMRGSNGKHSYNIDGIECSCGAIYDYEVLHRKSADKLTEEKDDE